MIRRVCAARLAISALLALPACSDGPLGPVSSENTAPSDSALVAALATAYRERDAAGFAGTLANRDGAQFVFVAAPSGQSSHWGASKELRIHRRMFAPDDLGPGEPPVPVELHIDSLHLRLRPFGVFRDSPTSYRDGLANPDGLDPARWRATEATYFVGMQVFDRGHTFYGTGGTARFVVIEDRARRVGERGKFLLYRWEDHTSQTTPGAAATDRTMVPGHSWSYIKEVYAGDVGLDTEAGVVDALARAYRRLDAAAYDSLLATAPPFRALLSSPTLDGRREWDRDTEILVHRRMFEPLTATPALPARLRIRSIALQLHPQTDFVERPELYGGGVDRNRWRATRATYRTDAVFTMQDTTRLRVQQPVRFTVLEDRALVLGDPAKFVVLQWEEIEPTVVPTEGLARAPQARDEHATWSELQQLYLPPPPIDSEATLVRFLQHAYRWRDYALFSRLLAPVPGAEYRFVRAAPDSASGEMDWDRGTETRVHVRMFAPEIPWPGAPPVPPALHLRSAAAWFFPQSSFVERVDLYRDPVTNPNGLDLGRWRATEATYSAEASFVTADFGEHSVHGPARFVVLQDRGVAPGGGGRFLLYRWTDVGAAAAEADSHDWTGWKSIYR